MAETTPETLSKDKLKEVARTIVAAQSNKYVKELLRAHKIPIGVRKEDFRQHMMTAIDEDRLTQPIIEQWLGEVEGWGRQHIYLYPPPLLAPADLEAKLKASAHAGLLATPVSYDFPEQLLLTSMALTDRHLSLLWHIGDVGWERVKEKDLTREEEGDLYEYRAFRERADRSVVRFEWRFADPYCAVLIQLPNKEGVHDGAIATVFDDLGAIGIADGPPKRFRLSKAVKESSKGGKVVVQSTRMGAPGGYVELAATAAGAGIDQIQPVREARKALDDNAFTTADGTFGFDARGYPKVSMPVKAEVHGGEGRIRIWAQCTREDVYLVTEHFWSKN